MNADLVAMFDMAGLVLGFLLTLAVFSYLLGDNPLYRIAMYLLVGVAVGYATVVAIDSVLLPWVYDLVALTDPDAGIDMLLVLPPLVLALLLLFKTSQTLAPLGNVTMAFLVGVGAAVAVVGAVTGTLLPQMAATLRVAPNPDVLMRLVNGGIIVAGTAFTVMYFFYGSSLLYFVQGGQAAAVPNQQRSLLLRVPAMLGELFILVTLAALYVGALNTAMVFFSERLFVLVDTVFVLFEAVMALVGG